MEAEITSGREYGTDRLCEIGRIVYVVGIYSYVALTFRYMEGEPSGWFLTWAGEKNSRPAQFPMGTIRPSDEMLAALEEAV